MKNKEICFEKVKGKYVYRLIKLVNIKIDRIIDADEEGKLLEPPIVLEIGEIYEYKTVQTLFELSLQQPDVNFVVIA